MARRLFQYDPLISYTFIPCLKARVEHESGGYLFKTNKSGFRCKHEFEQNKKPSRKRILLFGDSFTAGDGVSDGSRYSDILETLLPDTDVFNFGMPGTGTDQHYLIWKKFAKDLEHDLVIIGVQVHNINRIIARYRRYLGKQGNIFILSKPYFEVLNNNRIKLNNVPVPSSKILLESLNPEQMSFVEGSGNQFLRSLVTRFNPKYKYLIQKLLRYQPLNAYSNKSNPSWLLMQAILNEWTSEINKPVIICPIPIYQYIEEIASASHYRERFMSLNNPPKITVHDPLIDFFRYPLSFRKSFRFKVDQHFTLTGHKALAQSLHTVINSLMLPT